MDHKAGETTCNISSVFGPGTANKCTVHWWFKKFCKGDESLADEHNGQPLEVDKQQLRAIVEADPLTTTWGGAEELNVDHLVIWHLKQIGKVKKFNKWMPHELTINQKNHHFEVSSSLIPHNNNEPFLNWIVTCNEKWILYDNRQWLAQWLDREEASKHFPKPDPFSTIKAIIITIRLSADPLELTHCDTGSADQYPWWISWPTTADLTHYSFLNSGETITPEKFAQEINELHWKPQCLQPALFNRKGPILFHNNIQPYIPQSMLQTLNKLGYEVLPHLPYSLDFSPANYYVFKQLRTFLQGKHFHNQKEAENAFQECIGSQGSGFYATGINKRFLLEKMCWL